VLRTTLSVSGEKVAKMVTYLASSVLIARVVGPEIFGQYSTLVAVAIIFTSISAMGLNALLVKEFLQAPSVERVLTNVIILRLQAACVAATLMIPTIVFGLGFKLLPSAIIALVLPIAIFQVLDSMFESRLEMGQVLKYKTIAYISGLGIKVATVLVWPDLVPLLFAHVAEMLLILFGATIYTAKAGVYFKPVLADWRYRWGLVQKGFPLLLSSGAVLLYMKIDLPMIMAFAGAQEAGVYSVATRLCEALFILSLPIIVGVFPTLQRLYVEDRGRFEKCVGKVFTLLACCGVVTYIVASVAAESLVSALYGVEYAQSVDVIRIFLLSLPIIFVGDLLSRWLIITDNLSLSFYRHILGLLVNVGLNYLLIPLYGGVGAASASVAGYTSAVIVLPILNGRARKFFNFMRFR